MMNSVQHQAAAWWRLLLFGTGVSLVLFACTLGPDAASDSEAEDQRPNIVFILADDLGYSDISPYGSEIETPHLRRLAEGGMRFTQMHNTSKCFLSEGPSAEDEAPRSPTRRD